jgi:hypothetical protein
MKFWWQIFKLNCVDICTEHAQAVWTPVPAINPSDAPAKGDAPIRGEEKSEPARCHVTRTEPAVHGLEAWTGPVFAAMHKSKIRTSSFCHLRISSSRFARHFSNSNCTRISCLSSFEVHVQPIITSMTQVKFQLCLCTTTRMSLNGLPLPLFQGDKGKGMIS